MTDKFCPLIQGKTCDKLCGFYSEEDNCCEIIAMSKQVLGLNQTEPKETFLALIAKGHRITIYEPVRESIGAEIGDTLRVTVNIHKKSSELPPQRTRKSIPKIEAIAEPDDIEETVIEDSTKEEEKADIYELIEKTDFDSPFANALVPLEEEIIGQPLIEEEKPPEKVTTVTGADEEIVVFDEEPEEVVEYVVTEPIVPDYTETLEEEKGPEYEYVDPCVNGLDWPLQDLKTCRGIGQKADDKYCPHYKRKYGANPARCTWDGWRKIGWEDDVDEEPVEDIVEEPTEEKKPEEHIIEVPPVLLDIVRSRIEYDDIIMMQCASGAHKTGIVPHGKKDLGGGWAMYTCTVCGKETPMLIRQAEPEDPF